MQTSWRQDNDKLTFIACLPPSSASSASPCGSINATQDDAPARMIGDINLFLTPSDDSDLADDNDYEGEVDDSEADVILRDQGDASDSMDVDGDDGPNTRKAKEVVGEVELMVALPQHRRRGYGRAALLCFLTYVFSHEKAILAEYAQGGDAVGLKYLRVKIGQDNVGSIGLFESVGFARTAEGPNYFGEVELRFSVNGDVLAGLNRCKGWESVSVARYEH